MTITRKQIEGLIASETFTRPTNGTLTICVLTLGNGNTVTGESNTVNVHDFDAEIGKKAAREDAINKLWTLEGYAVKRDASTLAHRAARAGHEAMRVISALGDGPEVSAWADLAPENRSIVVRDVLRVFANPAITPQEFVDADADDPEGIWDSMPEIDRARITAFILIARSIAGA